uniref:GCR139 n=1 Tax=Schmidtea mediterranea TaxID=79327 RepID=A0A193KUF3_SCHMD|nr:GCR139 [Schmidtea mediterranea]
MDDDYFNRSIYENRSLEFFYHREMYTQCAEHSLNFGKKQPTTYCDNFISIGGIVALLTIPTVWVGFWGNVILFSALLLQIRRSARQEIYGVFFSVVDTMNLLYTGILINFGSKGLPWLGFQGFYIEYASPLMCKFSKFFQVFLNCYSINMLFCEALGRLIMIKSRGAHSPRYQHVIYFLCVAMAISFVQCSPIITLYNLRRPDGRYDCVLDPGWPRAIIQWFAIHRLLYCDGLIQCIFILFFNCINILGLLKLRATIEYIDHTAKESNIVSDTLKQITRLLHNIERDTQVVVIHSTIIAFLFLLKSSVSYEIYEVLYVDYTDNTTVNGVLINYKWTSIEDIVIFLYFLCISCHMWLYYFIIPPFRSWIRDVIKKVTKNNPSVLRVVDMFMLTDNEMGETPDQWRKSQNYLQNLDPVLYERIRQLEGALKQTDVQAEPSAVDVEVKLQK